MSKHPKIATKPAEPSEPGAAESVATADATTGAIESTVKWSDDWLCHLEALRDLHVEASNVRHRRATDALIRLARARSTADTLAILVEYAEHDAGDAAQWWRASVGALTRASVESTSHGIAEWLRWSAWVREMLATSADASEDAAPRSEPGNGVTTPWEWWARMTEAWTDAWRSAPAH